MIPQINCVNLENWNFVKIENSKTLKEPYFVFRFLVYGFCKRSPREFRREKPVSDYERILRVVFVVDFVS